MMGKTTRGHITYRCSFCGKGQEMVKRLIAGPGGVYICDECVALCQEIINEEARVVASKQTESPGWVATTHTHAGTSDQPETNIPAPTPCPQCQTDRVLADIVNGPRLFSPAAKARMAPGAFSEMWAIVCPACGCATFYAKNPEKLKQ